MHATIDRDAFVKALTIAGLAVARVGRTTLPILTTVRLSASADTLRVSGTNLEQAITTRVPAIVEDAGVPVCVDAKALTATIKALPKGNIHLLASDATLTISTPDGAAVFSLWDEDDYPLIPAEVDGSTFNVGAAALARAVACTAPFAATEDSRPIFTAVNAVVADNTLTLVSCDGFRLAHATLATAPGGCASSANVPATSLALLAKLLRKQTGRVTACVNAAAGRASFGSGDTLLFTRLVEGQYVNYRNIVPTSYTAAISGDAASLLAAFNRLCPLCHNRNTPIVTVAPAEGGVLLTTADSESPASARVPAVLSGPVPTLAVNASFMVGTLALFSGPVEIKLTDARGPYSIAAPGDSSVFYLHMPCRVSR